MSDPTRSKAWTWAAIAAVTTIVLAAWTILAHRSKEDATGKLEVSTLHPASRPSGEEIPDGEQPGIVRTPLSPAPGDAPPAPSQTLHWRNPKRDRAGMAPPGLYGQKYHPTLVPLEQFGDALVAALESSSLFNPEKIVLTAEEKQTLGREVSEFASKFQTAKTQASDIAEAALLKKRSAGEFAETYPAGSKIPKMEEVLAKYQGGRNDRILSLDWKDGGFAVIVLTLEECPEPFDAKATRGAAYDAMVEYLFSFFEDATNRRRT